MANQQDGCPECGCEGVILRETIICNQVSVGRIVDGAFEFDDVMSRETEGRDEVVSLQCADCGYERDTMGVTIYEP